MYIKPFYNLQTSNNKGYKEYIVILCFMVKIMISKVKSTSLDRSMVEGAESYFMKSGLLYKMQ